jgi:arginine repressor
MSIAIVFHENKQTEQDYIIKKFQKDGFLITKSSISRMILICTSNDLLEKEAERINLLIHNKHNVLQTFLTENRSQFLLNKAQREIFKPSEKNLLLLSLLEQVK